MSIAGEVGKLKTYSELFIGGRWVEPATTARIASISATTEEVLAHVPEAQTGDVDAAVAAARKAFDEGPWPHLPPTERAEALRRIRDEIAARIPEMARAFSAEIGAPLALSTAFHEGALTMWAAAANVLERFAFEEERDVDGGSVHVVHEPLGVAAAITPWNAPVPNASIKAAPALASGCTLVVKPAPEGPVSAMMLAEAFEAAGLPEGVVSVLPAGREVGEHLVRHPDVDKVTFTGSTAAGRRIMSICGERVARVTLELGGKSPAVIADDVSVDEFLPALVMSGIQHSGQICAALTRIVVPRRRHDELVEQMAEHMRSITVGDPMDDDTELGPLAAERQRDRVEEYVAVGRSEGATLVTGGRRPPQLTRGWFYEPTLFANVDNSSRIAQEEIFGPVLCVIPFDDLDDAVRIANDTIYGLSAAVYAEDVELGERLVRQIKAGQVWLNNWGMCVTEPFGGFKQSGLGREGGVEGMSAYLETKLLGGLPADR